MLCRLGRAADRHIETVVRAHGQPDGLLVGADDDTRRPWTWGDAATNDSPIAHQAAQGR